MTELRDLTDRVESLHSRMDRFYVWADELQKQTRILQNKVKFIESQCEFDVGQAAREEELLQRVERARARPVENSQNSLLLTQNSQNTSHTGPAGMP
jgi:hypothetical protein